MTTHDLLTGTPSVVTAGAALFPDALRTQGVEVTEVTWAPPTAGTSGHLARVLADPRRVEANRLAAERMLAAGAHLVDVRPASEALGLERGQFLHAGPPVTWENASGPLRGALIGAVLFEGLAADADEAERLLASGSFSWEPCHHRGAVGPMAGVVSPSMWVFELVDPADGRTAWCSLNEGLGKVLRYGAYNEEVVTRLRWMADVLGPVLQAGVRRARSRGAELDMLAIVGQMIQMGDEGHNRNRAGTLMLMRDLLPDVIESGVDPTRLAEVVRFVGGNDHFFLNLVMPVCKLVTSAAAGIEGSSVVTVMARNGTEFGIQTSGTGDRWFTGPAQTPNGLFLGDYGPDDANPDIGDSAITETAGIGGFVMAAAPAIVRIVGGEVGDALTATRSMYEITTTENPRFGVPILDFRGAPTAIDVTSVIGSGVLPQINTGMAGRVPGTGQVGAGLVTPPMECFVGALEALADAAPPLG
ncbi:DUF1116 domain-containing protein [Nocardioides zeae]|uniref:DUF1116 domain-containing protein n=1 Tax=Nocardioides imazamoxiresistens TaxID=3231893 RepID=A0ABU3PXQ1_9ACTN|nr:DUF1116 domain-containing protein [Nocardioides zeae]MDT9594018.1 DUF1116 domain-containing protein [Nocardioides zeae]